MSLFSQPFKLGFKGKLYENLADPGATLFGGAGVSNSLGQKRDEKSTGLDWFGSPVTAGTDSQGMARLGALLYGGYAGAGAMGMFGGGGAAGGSGAAAGGPSSGLGGLFGSSATGGGGSTAGMGGGAGWQNYARLGNMAMNMGGGGGGGGQPGQPLQHQFVGQTPQNPYLGLYNT
jgi:hypothetical protein